MDSTLIVGLIILIPIAFILFMVAVYITRWVFRLDGIYKELKIQSELLSKMAEKQGVDIIDIHNIKKINTEMHLKKIS